MIPLSDENVTLRTPLMTWVILGALFAVWLVVQGGGFDSMSLVTSVCRLGMIPSMVTHHASMAAALSLGVDGQPCGFVHGESNAEVLLTPLTSMFLHASWSHILGNAVFLWVFGSNIEDSMGPGRFLTFYLICGLAAAAAQVLIDPLQVPTVGASGAISGVLGGYLVLYPRVRVNMLFWFIIFVRVIPIPAWIVLVYWFVVQVVVGLPQLSPNAPGSDSGVAVWAHIGGFIAGAILVKVFAQPRMVGARNAARSHRGTWPRVTT